MGERTRGRGDWEEGCWGPVLAGPVHWDPPLPVGASLRGAGVVHAATVAEGEPAGLPVLGEHC